MGLRKPINCGVVRVESKPTMSTIFTIYMHDLSG